VSLNVAIQFAVAAGYIEGDYAKLHGNDGLGGIDWNTPLSNEVFDLFPDGIGIYGWGRAPWGHFRWGWGHSVGAAGWGHLPWGRFPWGYGTAVIRANHKVEACGVYKFGYACYDRCGNVHSGSPEEVTADLHIAPVAPGGLKKYSYDAVADSLILDVA